MNLTGESAQQQIEPSPISCSESVPKGAKGVLKRADEYNTYKNGRQLLDVVVKGEGFVEVLAPPVELQQRRTSEKCVYEGEKIPCW